MASFSPLGEDIRLGEYGIGGNFRKNDSPCPQGTGGVDRGDVVTRALFQSSRESSRVHNNLKKFNFSGDVKMLGYLDSSVQIVVWPVRVRVRPAVVGLARPRQPLPVVVPVGNVSAEPGVGRV